MSLRIIRAICLGVVVGASVCLIVKSYLDERTAEKYLPIFQKLYTQQTIIIGTLYFHGFQSEFRNSKDPIQIPSDGPLYVLFQENNFEIQTGTKKNPKLLDSWKTPIHFIKEHNELLIYSFGPDKIDNKGVGDDVVSEDRIEL